MDTTSILSSIKKPLGIADEYTQFDEDIIIHINGVLFTLTQLGVGPSNGFFITGYNEKWDDFTGSEKLSKLIQSYVYLKVRLLFDPPTNSALIESFNKLASEYEWRITVYYDEHKDQIIDPDIDYDLYEGSYNVTPRVYSQELDTDNSILLKDINIEKIPLSVAGNTANGETATIG